MGSAPYDPYYTCIIRFKTHVHAPSKPSCTTSHIPCSAPYDSASFQQGSAPQSGTKALPCVTGGWPVDVMCWFFVLVQPRWGMIKEVFMHLGVDLCTSVIHLMLSCIIERIHSCFWKTIMRRISHMMPQFHAPCYTVHCRHYSWTFAHKG